MGIGYGDDDDNTVVPQTVSVYLRCKFNIDDVSQIAGLFLNVDYDDGFVAYINGNEIARENLVWQVQLLLYTIANTDHEAQMYQGNLPNSYSLSNMVDVLQNGEINWLFKCIMLLVPLLIYQLFLSFHLDLITFPQPQEAQ